MIRRGGYRATRPADRMPPPQPAPPLDLVRDTRRIFTEVHGVLDLLDAAVARTADDDAYPAANVEEEEDA